MNIFNLDTNFFTPDILILIFIAFSCVLLILFISLIILSVRLSKMKKHLKRLLPTNENTNIEDMLIEYNKNVNTMLNLQDTMLKKIDENKNYLENSIDDAKKLIYLTNEKLKSAVQKVSIIRYNPFEGVGGDLCYAIALLDDNNNGLVINSIYSRDACYSYAKEIINGESKTHKLSDEEIEALNKAMKI